MHNHIDNWDFETGDLTGWTSTGTAFRNQPVHGNYIESTQVHPIALGGDYWQTPLFTGQHGNYWICTATSPTAEGSNGTLTSQEFVLTQRYICFLIAGTRDHEHIRVELQGHRANLEQIYTYSGDTNDTELLSNATHEIAYDTKVTTNIFTQKFAHLPTDDEFLVLMSATGHNSEIMRQENWDLSSVLSASKQAKSELRMRIKISISSAQGHINIDHFQFLDDLPEPYREPVWGFVDLHCHPFAHMAYGGKLIWGKPDDTIEKLQFCDGAGHGGGLASAYVIHEMEGQNTHYPAGKHATGPWPHFASLSHQEMHVDWIKRAHEGGLRILCGSAVHNQLLEAFSHTRPFHQHRPEDDMSVALRQIDALHKLADTYHEWMQVATSAADARSIIASNKLALIPALELDFLGNWRDEKDCTSEQISALLQDLFARGVRLITPIHLVNNAFGGCAIYDDLFNSLNHYFHGAYYEVEDGQQVGISYRLSDKPNTIKFGWILPRRIQQKRPLASYQTFPAGYGHINRKGLSDRGRDLLREMMRLGMLIDVTHMGEKTLNGALDLAESSQYPVMATHVTPRELMHGTGSEISLTRNQIERIRKLSGMIGLMQSPQAGQKTSTGADSASSSRTESRGAYSTGEALSEQSIAEAGAGNSRSWAHMYRYMLTLMHGEGLAAGTDFNGMVVQASPRFGDSSPAHNKSDMSQATANQQVQGQENAVLYAHYQQSGQIPPQIEREQIRSEVPPLTSTSHPTSDINIDGLAHYGMLPDFLQDVKNIGVTSDEMASLFHTAEYFLRLWETCEQKKQ